MRIVRLLLIPLTFGAVGAFLLRSGSVDADSILLKNGRVIEGKIVDNGATSGTVVIEVPNGRLLIPASQVQTDPPAPPVEKKEAAPVAVEATKKFEPKPGERIRLAVTRSGDFYGDVVYDGTYSTESDDKKIVLEVPGGKLRFERRGVSSMVKLEEPAPPKPAPAEGEARVIETTHEIQLTNGRVLKGTLMPSAETEPLKLAIGSLGTVKIAREKVAKDGIKEVSGKIEVPPPPPPPAAEVKAEDPAAARERMKRELREEILRKLLDEIIEEKVGAQTSLELETGREPGSESLSPEEVKAIEQALYELGRQRTQNRVRAENHLRAMGKKVIPYLEKVARHPFELTRRAVQRLVRDIGDSHGIPIAIDGLNDPDPFVREIAHEALRSLFPAAIAYDPQAPEKTRLAAQSQYHALWDRKVREEARETVLRTIEAVIEDKAVR